MLDGAGWRWTIWSRREELRILRVEVFFGAVGRLCLSIGIVLFERVQGVEGSRHGD